MTVSRSRMRGMMAAAVLAVAAVPASALAAAGGAAPQGSAATATVPDVAQAVVLKLFPVGTYRLMMGESFSKMMDGMVDGMMAMPASDLARIGGLSDDQAAQMSPATVQEAMAIIDPHFRDRMTLGTKQMMSAMTDLMDSFEPKVREALAKSYARRFTPQQLAEMDRFFSTPTGSAYAAQSMTVFMGPEMMGTMRDLMPEMMKRMPDMAKKAQAAVKDLPPPRRIRDLSKDEREKLARLLGTNPKDLKDLPDSADNQEGNGL